MKVNQQKIEKPFHFNIQNYKHDQLQQMTKSRLRKISNLKTIKCKQLREMTFAKNSVILNKNESTKCVYLLKTGQAAILPDNDSNQPLYIYKQGDYLNSVQVCMSMGSYKIITAISKCQVLLMQWSKQRQDEQKKNIFIPKIQQMKFYQVSLLRNISYGVMVELILRFSKQTVSKYLVNEFLASKKDSTCFVINGMLTIQAAHKHKLIENLRYSGDYFQSRLSIHHLGVTEKTSKLLRIENGGLLYLDDENMFKYVCDSDNCQIISIKTDLLNYFLTPQTSNKIQEIKYAQKINLLHLQTNTEKALKSISKTHKTLSFKSQLIPKKFFNPIQKRFEQFEKARSLHYKKNNKYFKSFSEEKKNILELRDQGYKEVREFNKREYGRNYINSKRLEVSKNINGEVQILITGILENAKKSKLIPKNKTVYESVNLKNDFAIVKSPSLVKSSNKSKMGSKSKFTSLNVTPRRSPAAKEIQIQKFTLQGISKARQNLKNDSKTFLKHYNRQQMVLQF